MFAEQHRRQPDVAEHQADRAAREGNDEAPDAEGDQLEGVHGSRQSRASRTRE
jgi:hypothetical protein